MSFSAREFRSVLGHFATGVTVVTTCDATRRAGITVNAFASLSLDPPLVLICLDTSSYVHDMVRQAGYFAVNLLTEAQSDISNCFAGSTEYRYSEFCGVLTHTEVTGAPVFNDCLGWIDCRVEAVYPGGDHSIFLGRVEALHADEGTPLLYYQGRYPQMGALDAPTRNTPRTPAP